MQILSDMAVHFLKKQEFVIVSTLNEDGAIHCSVKGIVGIAKEGQVFLIDLYRASTYNNLKNNPVITITAVDGHLFTGYSLQGTAKMVEREEIKEHLIVNWEERVLQRISKRMVQNMKDDKPHGSHHPETMFPLPQYLIEVDVEKVIDLAPAQLKKGPE
ncbi:MAG: pyridoxamine 5'-phosphate oxidase family protein [Candidatus Omnitrophica bacterium]|nr:pyridoxamine 5'-phosphate oxidase family protein [Candidatus Omnitrophota bacterium]MBU4479763.1 pyridoxamine 5'-phosphate oxidase family protein [Candidatus Omnitrophota bacterium]MCG2703286.1 pyridoxamine 5'-phosphate oxidase family protein [Candidatus Omnitrophota bacterium]